MSDYLASTFEEIEKRHAIDHARFIKIREAERAVIKAAREWDGSPTNEALCLLLSEAVYDLKEAEK